MWRLAKLLAVSKGTHPASRRFLYIGGSVPRLPRQEITMTQASTTFPQQPRRADERARNTGSQIGEMASDFASAAGERIEGAVQTAERVASDLKQQGHEAGERVGEVAGNLKGALDKSVREQPMATLALAAALGFVIGALWKS
jgi:ElaB/YqjD/DUF883 family membrane-anchored ribosome-binding protein